MVATVAGKEQLKDKEPSWVGLVTSAPAHLGTWWSGTMFCALSIIRQEHMTVSAYLREPPPSPIPPTLPLISYIQTTDKVVRV